MPTRSESPPPRSPHGSESRYSRGCRCGECTTAASKSVLTRRQKRARERQFIDGRMVHPAATHGTLSGYRHYSCRCTECTAAQAASSAEFRASQKEY